MQKIKDLLYMDIVYYTNRRWDMAVRDFTPGTDKPFNEQPVKTESE